MISLLYISQGEPEFQTFVAILREQGNDNEGRANQADLQFSIRRNREQEFRETWMDQAEGSGEDVGTMAEDVGETDIEERKDLFLTVPLKQLQFGFSKVLTPHVIKSQVTGGESNGSNMDMSTVYEKAVGKCPVVTV